METAQAATPQPSGRADRPNPPSPDRFHAIGFLLGTISDSGRGPCVNLKLDTGSNVTCRFAGRNQYAIRNVRPEQGFTGQFAARVYLRTTRNGTPKPCDVTRLWASDGNGLEGLANTWSASGKVLMLDRAEKVAVIRIFPSEPFLEPFTITAQASLDLLTQGEDARFVHLQGRIEQALILEQITPVTLNIPEHWRGWIPPAKRKQIQVPNALNENG